MGGHSCDERVAWTVALEFLIAWARAFPLVWVGRRNGRFPPLVGVPLPLRPRPPPPQDRLYFVMEYVTGRLDVPHSTAGQV